MAYEVRELSVSEVLDQAINLVKNHFWLLFKIALFITLPTTLITNYVVKTHPLMVPQGGLDDGAKPPEVDAARALGGPRAVRLRAAAKLDFQALKILGVLSLVNLLLFPLPNAAMIFALTCCYLGQPIGVGVAFRRSFQLYFPMLLTTILTGFTVMLGLMLCIVPGILFMLWFAVSLQAVVIEAASGPTAMGRSRTLVQASMLNAFLVWLLAVVIGGMLGFAPALVPQAVLGSVLQSGVAVAVWIFTSAVWVVFYFSCRAKSENFDLMMLADAVGQDQDRPDAGTGISPSPAG